MKGICTFAFTVIGALAAAGTAAQAQAADAPERRSQGGTMGKCGEMMKGGGMMGGMTGRDGRPNEQWRKGKGEK
jgi:hypothetical protein